MTYTTQYSSPVGRLTLACDGISLTGLWLEGQKYFGSTLEERAVPQDALPIFSQAKGWLDRYFSGEISAPDELPLAPAGSLFRQAVWRILTQIPWGQVVTYKEIADQVSSQLGRSSMSGQAVGGAVAHNPISIIIPCHRVVGTGGSLTGYAGGIDKKIWLLTHEGVDAASFSRPKR